MKMNKYYSNKNVVLNGVIRLTKQKISVLFSDTFYLKQKKDQHLMLCIFSFQYLFCDKTFITGYQN